MNGDLSMSNQGATTARFEALLAVHGAGPRRVARAYAARPDDVADLAQEIAVAVWRALPTFRGDSSERTFVFRIAHTRGISHREARRVRDAATPLVDPSDASDASDAPRALHAQHALQIADSAPAPDDAMDAASRRAGLWRAIGALPIGARSVLLLALEGLSHDEIADVLGTTSNSVAVRLNRARALLRTQMGVEHED